ncbi:MAG: peptidylprolyl isomerase [Clostridia bacterium]|nr:peptidylprolyl isomerase [Clostridia bacterium]
MPAVGDQIAVMHTSMGDISIRFFPEAAPKAVENFVKLSEQGYYNNLTFHRVIEDFMIQGGDPKGDGTGGESYWKSSFEDEFDQKLLNLRGSLAMANSGVNTNGSQFFINQGGADAFGERTKYAYSDEDVQALKSQYDGMIDSYGKSTVEAYYGKWEDVLAQYMPLVYDSVPDEVWDLYEKNGGNITLDGAWRQKGGHTVFGQVFAGMDVVDAIAAVETDSNDKPTTAVTITSIEITTYQG